MASIRRYKAMLYKIAQCPLRDKLKIKEAQNVAKLIA